MSGRRPRGGHSKVRLANTMYCRDTVQGALCYSNAHFFTRVCSNLVLFVQGGTHDPDSKNKLEPGRTPFLCSYFLTAHANSNDEPRSALAAACNNLKLSRITILLTSRLQIHVHSCFVHVDACCIMWVQDEYRTRQWCKRQLDYDRVSVRGESKSGRLAYLIFFVLFHLQVQ